MKTQVCIIGGGPSGLLLGQLLEHQNISTVILERRTRNHVLGRIRAGILETGFVDLMRRAGVADRLEAEGLCHDGIQIAHGNRQFGIDFRGLTGQTVTVYGQTEVTRDLYEARHGLGVRTLFTVENVTIHGADTQTPQVTFAHHGREGRIDCDFVVGCDGFHGVSRQAIPAAARRTYEKTCPFGWLGVLSQTPPVHDQLIYASSGRGFALCSMRTAALSRYYIQCPLSDRAEDWTDQAFWDELRRRLPAPAAEALVTGPAIEKSITPLRSFVIEPMQWGRLFLCGDAAHIVPPTGAKGLNTAAGDVHYLSQALVRFYADKDRAGLDGYSEKALARVWKTQRFSWWMTRLLHRFPEQSGFDLQLQRADLEGLETSREAQAVLAQNYVGLPW